MGVDFMSSQQLFIEVKDNDNNTEVPDQIYVNQKEIKSLFHMLNARPDGVMKVFPRDVIITYQDIFDLKLRIDDKLNQYSVLTKTEKMAVHYDNNTFKEYSDWVVFRDEMEVSSNTIDSINIIWDIMLNMEGYQIPQRHTISLRFCSGLKPAQIIQIMLLGDLEGIDSIDKDIFPVTCKVDCINNLIGEEILNIVSDWNKGLEFALNHSNFFTRLKKHSEKISKLIKYSSRILSLLLICFYICFYISQFYSSKIYNIDTIFIKDLILRIPIIYCFYIICKGIGDYVTELFNSSFYKYGETHNFSITKGDRNKQDKLKNNNKSLKKSIICCFSSIIINLIVGVIASILASKII